MARKIQDILDYGILFEGEPIFEIEDWETPKTTQFFTSEERDAMCEKAMGMAEARAVAFLATNPKYSQDDMKSFAFGGLAEALNNYDPRVNKNGKRAEFTTYAFRCITNSILRNLNRENSRIVNEISIDDAVSNDRKDRHEELKDIIPDNDLPIQTQVEYQEFFDILHEEMKENLDPIDYFILTASTGMYGEKKMMQQDIAAALNMSQANVSKRHKHAGLTMRLVMVGKHPTLVEQLPTEF